MCLAQTQKKRSENEQKRRQYLSNFKPSRRDEEQFAAKLLAKGLRIASMGEDGNCLFRSVSHQVYGKEDFHDVLRAKCVAHLKSEYAYFGEYMPGGHEKQHFGAYCARMRRGGVWGDNLEIQAFSEMYDRSIEIYAYDDKHMKTFPNDKDKDKAAKSTANARPPIRLSYHCNSHYNSIVRVDGGMHWLCAERVGEVEEDKIRLSSLRSSQAAQSTLALSDMQATDLECYEQALAESRRMFEGRLSEQGNEKLDGQSKSRWRSWRRMRRSAWRTPSS